MSTVEPVQLYDESKRKFRTMDTVLFPLIKEGRMVLSFSERYGFMLRKNYPERMGDEESWSFWTSNYESSLLPHDRDRRMNFYEYKVTKMPKEVLLVLDDLTDAAKVAGTYRHVYDTDFSKQGVGQIIGFMFKVELV